MENYQLKVQMNLYKNHNDNSGQSFLESSKKIISMIEIIRKYKKEKHQLYSKSAVITFTFHLL